MTAYLLLGQFVLGIALFRVRGKITRIDHALIWTGYFLVFALLLMTLMVTFDGAVVIKDVDLGPLYPP